MLQRSSPKYRMDSGIGLFGSPPSTPTSSGTAAGSRPMSLYRKSLGGVESPLLSRPTLRRMSKENCDLVESSVSPLASTRYEDVSPLASSSRFNTNHEEIVRVDAMSPGYVSRIAEAVNSLKVGEFPSIHLMPPGGGCSAGGSGSPSTCARGLATAADSDSHSAHYSTLNARPTLLSPRTIHHTHRKSLKVQMASPLSSTLGIVDKSTSEDHGTESTLNNSTKTVIQVLQNISRKRVHILLDDFESGSSPITKRSRSTEHNLCMTQLETTAQVHQPPSEAVLNGKRCREEVTNGEGLDSAKRVRTKSFHSTVNNEILSSLSSSVNITPPHLLKKRKSRGSVSNIPEPRHKKKLSGSSVIQIVELVDKDEENQKSKENKKGEQGRIGQRYNSDSEEQDGAGGGGGRGGEATASTGSPKFPNRTILKATGINRAKIPPRMLNDVVKKPTAEEEKPQQPAPLKKTEVLDKEVTRPMVNALLKSAITKFVAAGDASLVPIGLIPGGGGGAAAAPAASRNSEPAAGAAEPAAPDPGPGLSSTAPVVFTLVRSPPPGAAPTAAPPPTTAPAPAPAPIAAPALVPVPIPVPVTETTFTFGTQPVVPAALPAVATFGAAQRPPPPDKKPDQPRDEKTPPPAPALQFDSAASTVRPPQPIALPAAPAPAPAPASGPLTLPAPKPPAMTSTAATIPAVSVTASPVPAKSAEPAPKAPASTFSFGAAAPPKPPATIAPPDSAPKTNGFSFAFAGTKTEAPSYRFGSDKNPAGAPAPSPAPPVSASFSFGTPTTTTAAPAQTKAAPFNFGTAGVPATASTTASVFGGFAAATPPTTAAATVPVTGVFGSSKPFGTPVPSATSSSSTTSSGLFGTGGPPAFTARPTPATAPAPVFGKDAAPPVFGTPAFGTSTTSSTATTTATAAAPAFGSGVVFGTAFGQKKEDSATSAFGKAPAGGASGGGIFGSAATFGAPTGPFGSSATPAPTTAPATTAGDTKPSGAGAGGFTYNLGGFGNSAKPPAAFGFQTTAAQQPRQQAPSALFTFGGGTADERTNNNNAFGGGGFGAKPPAFGAVQQPGTTPSAAPVPAPAPAPAPTFGSAFGSPAFGTSAFGFGAGGGTTGVASRTQEPAKPPSFVFGSGGVAAAGFGAAAPAPAPKPFGFGGQTQAVPAQAGGQVAAAAPAPGASVFTFGQPPAQQTPGAFQFNAPPAGPPATPSTGGTGQQMFCIGSGSTAARPRIRHTRRRP